MATSGSVNSGAYQGRYLKFEWGTNSVSAANNTRNIWYKITATGGSGSYYHHNNSVLLNNIELLPSQYRADSVYISKDTVLANSNLTIDQNVEPYIILEMYGGIYNYSGTLEDTEELPKDWGLDPIPRYPSVTQSLNTKTSTSIKMNWSSDSTISEVKYSTDNGSSWSSAIAVNASSGNYTITGLTANTTYNIKTRLKRKDSGLTADSTALAVTTYKATIPTISLSSKTSTSVTVTSSCNVTVSSTQYRIKTSSGSYGAYQTSGTFSGLSPNTAYVVEVKKVGQESGEAGTATLSVTTYQKTTPTISLSSKTSSSITVTSSCNVTVSSTQYRIKVSGGSYGNYQTSATFSNLSANTTYVVEVKKVGQDSGEAGTATLSVTTYKKTTPTISLSNKTSSSITVTSSCNVTVSSTQYRIKKSSGSYGSYQSSASFTGLSANTEYIVEVKMVGKESGEAGTATVAVTTYQKTVPTITLSSKTSTSITVTSGCNVTASSTQYRIKKSTGSYGSYQSSGTFTGLSPNTAYVVEVKKVGQASGEAGTATLSVTTYQTTIATITLSSKTVNSITVSSSCNVTTSSVQYRIKTTSGNYGSYQTSATFGGLTPNTGYVVEVKMVGKDSGETGAATLSVTTYQIATISSASNFNHGDNSSLVVANPSSATITLAMKIGSTQIFSKTVSAGTVTNTFTDTQLDSIYRLYGTNNSLTVTYILTTTANSTSYTNSKTCTIILTGNQKTAYIGNSGVKRAKVYVGVNGTVKRAVVWVGNNNGRKRCI